MRSQVFQCCVGLIYFLFSSLPLGVPSSTTFWGMHLANRCLYQFSGSPCDIHRSSSLRHQKSKNAHPLSHVSVNGCKPAISLGVVLRAALTKETWKQGKSSLHLHRSQGSKQHQFTLLLLKLKQYILNLVSMFLFSKIIKKKFESEPNSYLCAPILTPATFTIAKTWKQSK